MCSEIEGKLTTEHPQSSLALKASGTLGELQIEGQIGEVEVPRCGQRESSGSGSSSGLGSSSGSGSGLCSCSCSPEGEGQRICTQESSYMGAQMVSNGKAGQNQETQSESDRFPITFGDFSENFSSFQKNGRF